MKLMTVKEVAYVLNVEPQWVFRNWKALGMPFIKVNRQLRMRPADLEAWIAARQVAA